ncbi:MAG TPA: Uma2 family endonuclease [Chloroflexota bacterium]|nr:Uma2 family endonuclease [Chloroflexota bacterium]
MTALVLPTDAPAVPGPPQGQWTYAAWEELPEYVIIDPSARRTLSHYRLEAPGCYAPPHSYGEAKVASFDCLPTISVPVGALFAGAPDTTL